MLNFNSILLSSENPEKLAEFYGKVFDKKPEMNEGPYKGYLVGSCFITIGPHDKVKGKSKNPERVLFNFETKDVKGEFARIKKLGAKVITEPYEMKPAWIATFADPDENYFQLITPWEDIQKEQKK